MVFCVLFLLGTGSILIAQEYYILDDFEDGASDDFSGWVTGGQGVASTAGGVVGRGAKFRDDISTLTTAGQYTWAGELTFTVMASAATAGADFYVYTSLDAGANWAQIWTISYANLSAEADKIVTETLSINVEDTPVMIRFESVNGGGDNGDYPFILDDVWLTKKVIPQYNTGFVKIIASCPSVSQEELQFIETVSGSSVYVAHDSIAHDFSIAIDVEPLHPSATVTIIRQANPAVGSADTAIFTITAADGVTATSYKAVVSRSTYHCKIGFLNYGGNAKPDTWTGGGGIFATGSQGQYGLYPGNNGFRMYSSSSAGEGRLTSPEFSSAGVLTFAAKFSITGDESLVISMSKDGGANWTTLETFVPADGRIPSYADESSADTLAMQSVLINEPSPVMIQFTYEGTSTTPRTMIDDVGLTAVKGITPEDGIILPRFITSNMVVQRNTPVKIWGWAAEGATVIGSFEGGGIMAYDTVQVGSNGKFMIEFPSMEAIIDPCRIRLAIDGFQDSDIDLDNILVGDVWFAGGQSNMEKKVNHLIEAAEVIANADNYPLIRSFKSSYQMSETPLDDVGENSIGWFECNSQATGDNVSAVAYIFALNVHLNENVPVGIIQAYRGGTEIETWMSQQKIQSDFDLFRVRERQALMDPKAEDADNNYPSIHFNGQINPFTSTPLKGFIFYQGESNTKRGLEFGCMMESLIDDWRTLWGIGELPFYYVQLFNVGVATSRLYEEGNWQDTRDQQLGLLHESIDNIGMAVSIDTNEDPDNIDSSIRMHPKNKKPIGERLALLALQHTYGKDTLGTSPVPATSRISSDTVYVTFENYGDGLKPAVQGEALRGFVVAGEDRNFLEALAEVVDDSTLAISGASVTAPVAVRYGWSKNPDCNLVNSAGLPASPFRTDDWPSGYDYTDSGSKSDADLVGIKINEVPLSTFDNSVPGMVVDIPETVTTVTAIPVPMSVWAETEVIQPTNLNGTEAERTATIVVRSNDETQERTFTLLFNPVPALDIFFALGQSNMAGRAPITADVSEEIDGVRLFDDMNNWTVASNPMNKYSNIRKDLSMQQVGPSYAFIKTISEYTEHNIGIAVNARGGTAIAAFARGEYRDPMFSRLRETKSFGEVKAIIWHQGESDNSKAGAYMADLDLLVGDLRAEFGDACFVAGQMGGWNAEGGATPKYAAINQVISTIGDHISNADFVTNEDIGHIGDYTHFNLESQILLGQRYAQKVLKLVYSVDISIVNVEMTGDGFAVLKDDTIFDGRDYSYTVLKGTDRGIEIFPEPGEVITSLVINGKELTDVAGAESHTYALSTTEDSKLTIALTSGIPENNRRAISGSNLYNGIIYPNPANSRIQIRSEHLVRGVDIFTLEGKLVMRTGETRSIDISALSPGSYIVLVNLKKESFFTMLIKC